MHDTYFYPPGLSSTSHNLTQLKQKHHLYYHAQQAWILQSNNSHKSFFFSLTRGASSVEKVSTLDKTYLLKPDSPQECKWPWSAWITAVCILCCCWLFNISVLHCTCISATVTQHTSLVPRPASGMGSALSN